MLVKGQPLENPSYYSFIFFEKPFLVIGKFGKIRKDFLF
ncbi:hypothetical protein B4102_1128 [Heyndrickxia sporothermodurans]|uniref:Uncharacterized protein n=1 Tax=Heyndrickxia sporothermodurans TaxID=46224 RepID=A0A150KN30_9BACI|nr:hypothetical protein B4102_1128 [Heyndrickxia sporothermodurans]